MELFITPCLLVVPWWTVLNYYRCLNIHPPPLRREKSIGTWDHRIRMERRPWVEGGGLQRPGTVGEQIHLWRNIDREKKIQRRHYWQNIQGKQDPSGENIHHWRNIERKQEKKIQRSYRQTLACWLKTDAK